ncbi:hypothetical protein DPMN_017127 [Dreissena polymorpha]|uniref:Uncharacterized protein n=1 Tax=Dreissena polymorpha TaxID=45954 RepID=A0A9D4NEL7_DREPO|nr:hypothetical protein DPMN_017127 [Dreissena polymorpha]
MATVSDEAYLTEESEIADVSRLIFRLEALDISFHQIHPRDDRRYGGIVRGVPIEIVRSSLLGLVIPRSLSLGDTLRTTDRNGALCGDFLVISYSSFDPESLKILVSDLV